MGHRASVFGRLVARRLDESEGRSFGPIGAIGAEKKLKRIGTAGGSGNGNGHMIRSMLRCKVFEFEFSLSVLYLVLLPFNCSLFTVHFTFYVIKSRITYSFTVFCGSVGTRFGRCLGIHILVKLHIFIVILLSFTVPEVRFMSKYSIILGEKGSFWLIIGGSSSWYRVSHFKPNTSL